jgi:hypothetical protein
MYRASLAVTSPGAGDARGWRDAPCAASGRNDASAAIVPVDRMSRRREMRVMAAII